MTRAGERVKGATSARPFRGRQGGGAISQAAMAQTAAQPEKTGRGIPRKVFQARGGGVVKSLGSPWLENRCPSHWRIFSHSLRISERPARLTATPSMAGQSYAPQSNGRRAERGDFFPIAELHRQGRQIGVRTERTVRTPHPLPLISADLVGGGCSHSPARQVGTAGTGNRPAARQAIRALAATPARSQPGCGGCYVA
jgi:hypothetical protein